MGIVLLKLRISDTPLCAQVKASLICRTAKDGLRRNGANEEVLNSQMLKKWMLSPSVCYVCGFYSTHLEWMEILHSVRISN